MSGWHSLSGALQYKSGNNAFGRLITKRRTWCVLDESQCKLLLYKSEDDVHKQRSPQGYIDLSGAAITLDLEHQNQFVIISQKKEHVFTADNHESMMIWLIGLQSKREMHHKKMASTLSSECSMEDDYEVWNNRPHLYMTNSENSSSTRCTNQRLMSEESLLRRDKWSLQRAAESVDSGISAYKKTSLDRNSNLRSRSLPPVVEGLEASKCFPVSPFVRQDLGRCGRRVSASHTYLAGDSDSDDVFAREIEFQRQQNQTLSRHWRKLQYAVLSHVIKSRQTPPDLTVTQQHPTSELTAVERRSASSRSASSDSAIEKGEGTAQELSTRLGELERELISTKCELAKVMNRQTSYQELLLQKDDTIKHLVGHSTDTHKIDEKKLSKQTKNEKDFQERIRVLQNQNRFLNEEVKKLAKVRLQEYGEYQEQNVKLLKLEADIEKWKMDYVSLIQSSIHYPGDEGFEDVELCLYGGDKHKKRIQTLLEDARKINPSLPTYDSLMNREVHVDTYGFKHVYTNTGLVLHYLCTELTHHFLLQAGVYEEHQRKWTSFMRQHGKNPMKCRSELKSLCRGGIPDRFRKQVWQHLVHYKVRDQIRTKGDYYYRNLCNLLPESPLAACYRKQVSLDLMRTMPNNIKFSASGCKGVMDLQDVLLAFCIHNPTIGYCQGMNFIAGMSLIFLDPEDSFWMLVAVAENYFSPHYFDHCLIGAQSDQQVLKDLVRDKLPALYQHLESIDIELCTITLNWFLAIFFDAVPFQTLLRIWDCFLLEGPKVLFRFSLSILKLHEKDILQKTDTMGIMKHLKACAKLTYDVEGLVKLSFEGLKPFPKRKDILSKQTCYLNALKEKYKKKELQRLAFAEREQLYMSMEAESGTFLGIECAVAANGGQVWFCYGDQHIGKLSFVSCETGTMFNIDFKVDSRLMCMCYMGSDFLLLGTLSWMLLSVDINKHEQVWQIQLHDAILSVCCFDDEEAVATRIFSGLADGTVAVTEKPYINSEPNVDVMYIGIGQAPVTCLLLLDEQLWCASGNTVAVIHARTLDTMDTFSVSVNPYDHILSLQPSNYGIWISLRGSSILELWDPRTLNCRMLYDTRTDRYPQLRKEDDTYFNRARITSTLANGNTVWIGTGEGNLIIYEVLESAQLKTPTEMSPSLETTSSMSYIVRPEKVKDKDKNETLPDQTENKICDTSNTSAWEVKSQPPFRRKSSSETDLGVLHKTHYHDDSNASHTLACGTMPRICSYNDIELLEKERNLSHCDDECMVNHAVEDDVELELEARARRESLTQLLGCEMTEQSKMVHLDRRQSCEGSFKSCIESEPCGKSSKDCKRKQTRLLISNTGSRHDHDDSGCESNSGLPRKGQASCSSSRRSSLSHRGSEGSVKCKPFPEVDQTGLSEEEEDMFEAHLEEQARRDSLVLNEIEVNCPTQVNTKNTSKFKGSTSLMNHNDKDNNVVNIYIDEAVDGEESKLEQIARRQSLLGIELFNLDDSYLSSSPSSSVSHDVFNEFKADSGKLDEELMDDEVKKSALGMSIDSTDDTECADERRTSNKNKLTKQSYGFDCLSSESDSCEMDDTCESIQGDTEVATNVTFETNQGRRSSTISILDDVSILCSDCNSQKKRCKDCKKLLKSQESLRINEKRLSHSETPVTDGNSLTSLLDNKYVVTEETKLKCVKDLSIESNSVTCNTDTKLASNNKDNLKGTNSCKEEMFNEMHNAQHEHVNVFSTEKMDKSDLSRQEKVGIWLNSLSHTFCLEDNNLDSKVGEKTGEISLLQSGCVQKEVTNNTDSGIMLSYSCEGSKKHEGKLIDKRSLNGYHSNKGSVDYEDVFYGGDESRNNKTERTSPDRPGTLNLLNRVTGGLRRFSSNRTASGESEGSSEQKSGKETVLNKKDPGVQYRLDFSTVHVETDAESELTTPNQSVHPEQMLHMRARYGSGDSRKNSLDLGSIKEKCSRLESECLTNQQSIHTAPDSNNDKEERRKLFEFLKTPSLASRHASLGLKIIDDDLEWTELCGAQYTTSPTSTTDKRLADFLRTPSMSSRPSSMWSSYENISTPSHVDDGKFLHPPSQTPRRLSHSASIASMGSDLLYNVDLSLEAKMKISDKPVKCLLATVFKDEPIILSFSGSHGDDEAVLKWRKHRNEQLWTNEPVLEICSKTNMAILPMYMRRRMSSNSSFNSH